MSATAPLAATLPASVFAHQGGWDELLLVGGPILLIGGLLALANRRAARLNEEEDSSPQPTP